MKLYRKHACSVVAVRWLTVLPIVAALALALPGLAQAGEIRLPDGIPNLTDPQVGAGWQMFQVGALDHDPDFPLVVFMNVTGNQPAAMLFAVDARNGKETFSLVSDPVILVAVFADPQTVTRIYYDEGFSGDGHPSGEFTQSPNPSQESLIHLLTTIVKPEDHPQPTQEAHKLEML